MKIKTVNIVLSFLFFRGYFPRFVSKPVQFVADPLLFKKGGPFLRGRRAVVCKSEPRQETSQSSAPSVPEKTHNRKLRNSHFCPFLRIYFRETGDLIFPWQMCVLLYYYCLRNRFGFRTRKVVYTAIILCKSLS